MLFLAMAVAFVASILLTPLVRKLAFRIGAVDRPNYRKVHASVNAAYRRSCYIWCVFDWLSIITA